MTPQKRIVIVGGVAGGASTAAKLRRLDEAASIVMFERGPHVSFANCGLPYFVGDVIQSESDLLVATPELFRRRFQIDVRTSHEVLSISRERHEIEVKDLVTGRVFLEPYDALVLAPGAAPIRPPLPGIDRDGIFVLRDVPDSVKIRAWIERREARDAVVVGAGFIGLEMAENLSRRGLSVHVVELAAQVLPPLDAEMAAPLAQHLIAQGVELILGDAVASFDAGAGGRLLVRTKTGRALETDLVLLAVGVKPESGLARAAGLVIGERGGIVVDAAMRTSDAGIWAVGDAVEVQDAAGTGPVMVPLAGPANRQGRIAAESISGRPARYRGTQATAIVGVFGMTAALTGATEKTLERRGEVDYEKVYLHPGHHAGYFPGAQPMHLKLLFSKEDGKLLGAQAVGGEGVDKRIDVLSMAIQMGATVHDLEEAELAYAPQYGAAKDPINVAGMIGVNALEGGGPIAHWRELAANRPFLLDVREPAEFADGHVAGAVSIPLGELRARLEELPKHAEIWVYCAAGQRGYFAARTLLQHGFRARNISGGMRTRHALELAGGLGSPGRLAAPADSR